MKVKQIDLYVDWEMEPEAETVTASSTAAVVEVTTSVLVDS